MHCWQAFCRSKPLRVQNDLKLNSTALSHILPSFESHVILLTRQNSSISLFTPPDFTLIAILIKFNCAFCLYNIWWKSPLLYKYLYRLGVKTTNSILKLRPNNWYDASSPRGCIAQIIIICNAIIDADNIVTTK